MNNPATPDPLEALHQRIVALEELFTHIQATVQALSDEVFTQGRQLGALKSEATRMKRQLDDTAATILEQRRLEDEKPPHY